MSKMEIYKDIYEIVVEYTGLKSNNTHPGRANLTYRSKSYKTAIIDGLLWTINEEKEQNRIFGEVSALKINHLSIGRVDKKGIYKSNCTDTGRVYDWKGDANFNTVKKELKYQKKELFKPKTSNKK